MLWAPLPTLVDNREIPRGVLTTLRFVISDIGQFIVLIYVSAWLNPNFAVAGFYDSGLMIYFASSLHKDESMRANCSVRDENPDWLEVLLYFLWDGVTLGWAEVFFPEKASPSTTHPSRHYLPHPTYLLQLFQLFIIHQQTSSTSSIPHLFTS